MDTEIKNIKNILDKHSSFLRKTYKVKGMALFGSFVRGQQTKKSDIDMLVDLSSPVGFFKFIELENFLTRVLGRKVDLVTKNALKPIIKKEVLRETVYV